MSELGIAVLIGFGLAGGYLAALGKHARCVNRVFDRLHDPKEDDCCACHALAEESRRVFPLHWRLSDRFHAADHQ